MQGRLSVRGWRDEVIDYALENGGEREDRASIVMAAIRRRMPGCCILDEWVERPNRLRAFLEHEHLPFRSLLSGEVLTLDREGVENARVRWYLVRYRDAEIEVLCPDPVQFQRVLMVGNDEELLREFGHQLQVFADRPLGRALVFSEGHWQDDARMEKELGRVHWDDVVLPATIERALRESVRGFVHHRAAFVRFGFPWRRGILLVGPPGTGKTMVCRAVAAELEGMPFLYVRDLSSAYHGEPLRAIFQKARELSPCLLVFEDIDGLLEGTRRGVFLNELDGLDQNDGLLVFASSNHPERIDEALLKRPSRFDRVFHIGLPARAEREEYGKRLLRRSALHSQLAPTLDVDRLVREVAERTEGFTPAFLKEVYLGAALSRAQAGAELLDDAYATAALQLAHELKDYLRRVKDPEALRDLTPSTTMGFASGE